MSTDEGLEPELESPDPEEELTIQQVSSLLGVPAPTMRSWERRYGVPQAGRSQGGHRRYNNEQIEKLGQMRDEIALGRRAVDAAARIMSSDTTPPAGLVDDFLQATMTLEPADLTRVLVQAHVSLGLDCTVDDVIMPALRQIGRRWEAGRCDVAHEHFASQATQAWLVSIGRTGPPPVNRPVVLSSGPLDHHTLGLDCIGALLRQRGWDCRMLGARMPADSLARAIVETDAVAVVLVCHLAPGRRAAIDSLHTVNGQHAALFYAGGAFASRQSRLGVPGHYLGTRLGAAADFITATVIAEVP